MIIQTQQDRAFVAVAAVVIVLVFLLAGCAAEKQQVFDTQTLDKPVPVRIKIERPKECPTKYPLDTLQAGASPVEIWRAAEAELEMRTACIIKLLAALTGAAE